MKIDKIEISEGSYTMAQSCLPTWHKGEYKYFSIGKYYYFNEDYLEDWDSEALSLGFVHSDLDKAPLVSMAFNITNFLDACEKGYKLDNPRKSTLDSFTHHNLVLDLNGAKVDCLKTFKVWCMFYDETFKAKKSFDDHVSYLDTNIYCFYKLSKLCYYLIEEFNFKTWQDLYNWCVDLINGESKIITEIV